jgi:hypothetical protein
MPYISSSPLTDLLTIEATSKAARITPYDKRGQRRIIKYCSRGTGSTESFNAAASLGAFYVISGPAYGIARVQRILVTTPVLTAVQYTSIAVKKYAAAPGGGTGVSQSIISLDNENPTPVLVAMFAYTAAPTVSREIGTIGNRRGLLQSSTAAAATIAYPFSWDFRISGESDGVALRSRDENLALNFQAIPATAVALQIEVEWTEEQ